MTRRGADSDRPEARLALPTILLLARPGCCSCRRREANVPVALDGIGVGDGTEPMG